MVLVVAALIATACQPQLPTSKAYPITVLTPDGRDRYQITDEGTGFIATAPTSNTSSNLRVAVLAETAPTSTDEQSCVTWNGPITGYVQPGLALRVRSDSGSNKAIMVTNNIYYDYRTAFNVHVVVSVASPMLKRVGSVSLPDAVGPDPQNQTPPPWRMCARVIGTNVDLKVWALAERPTEPAWGDPQYSGTVVVPTDWVYPGRPGTYVGHLAPGQSTSFTDLAVEALPAEVSPAA